MRVEHDEKGVLLYDIGHFEPRHIFECGQCFRFVPDGAGYTGVAHSRVLHVEKTGGIVRLSPCTEAEYKRLWHGYFDLDTDYEALLTTLPKTLFSRRLSRTGAGCGCFASRRSRRSSRLSFLPIIISGASAD